MSNTVLGPIYSQVIEEVINNSRGDFEDNGIDEAVLDSLREVWQSKLTQLNVASFPWDPALQPDGARDEGLPAPPLLPTVPLPQVAPASAPAPAYSQAHLSPAPAPQGLQLPTLPLSINGVHIKTEPGLGLDIAHIKQEPSDRQTEAASRAAENLKSAYGIRASGSIQAIHRGQPGKPGTPTPGQPTALPIFQPSLPSAQTDGAGGDSDGDDDEDDWEGVLLQKDTDGNVRELGRVDIDRLLHKRMISRAKAMEGGGLMLPLKEATKHKTTRAKRERAEGRCQFDGGEEDDDAINSDLDDTDDDADDDDADEEGVLRHIMLCMYDKVQRVKNKWKCTLKDGVLTVNGKEYVFHKATGEYEW